MTVLFDAKNKFTIAKVDGGNKVISFNTMKLVDIYYTIKRLSSEKQKHKYWLEHCTISRPENPMCVLKSGYYNILYELEDELNKQNTFTIVLRDNNNTSINTKFWHNSTEELRFRLKQLAENNANENKRVTVYDNKTKSSTQMNISELIEIYEKSQVLPSVPYTKETVLFPDVDSTGMDIHLDFNEVLAELTPAISKGSEQEKRDAKVILAYLAKKLVEQ